MPVYPCAVCGEPARRTTHGALHVDPIAVRYSAERLAAGVPSALVPDHYAVIR